MAATTMSATGSGRYLRGLATRAAVVALAGLSLLIAAPADSLGRVKKPVAGQSRSAVSHTAKARAARHLPAKTLTATKPAASARRHDRGKGAGSAAAALPVLRSAILIDADTGTILAETKPDLPLYPASLTKMMTLYLTFAALNEGRLRIDQLLPVSAHAAGQAPTKLWLKPGDTVPVQALILGLVTRSANDAAVVLAEALADSETDFAALMTETARRLGMNDTVFRNASGLPDPQQHTTARDLARLSLALFQDFPREYRYFSVREFAFRGQKIATHNHLLDSYEGSDGIKTGFTRASGFNLAASAEHDGHRLIGVVLGSPSWPVRDRAMAALLDSGFATLGAVRVAAADRVEPAPGQAKPAALAARLAAHAAPSATPAVRPAVAVKTVAKAADRAIRLGVFRARSAAARLARRAARLKPAKGKDVVVRKLPGGRKGPVYAVQVSDFTDAGARDACGMLRKAKLSCSIVPEPDEG